jgi:hypothetical protein
MVHKNGEAAGSRHLEASPTSETAAKRFSSMVTLLDMVKCGSLEITRSWMTIIWKQGHP